MSLKVGLGCGIEHVVVLMFENRSFDNLMGALYPAGYQANGHTFDGLPLDASNLDFAGKAHKVWTEDPPVATGAVATTPNPDPGERFQDVNYQLYAKGFDRNTPVAELGVPSMDGFVKDYVLPEKTKYIGSNLIGVPWPRLPRRNGKQKASPEAMMHYFSPAQLPISSTLAKQYAICDRWFSSVGTETFANRLFAFAASSDGDLDDVEMLLKHGIERYRLNNLLQVLDQRLGKGPNWRIYYDETASSYSISEILLRYVHDHRHSHLRDFKSDFAADVASGLPPFTFIEPNYGHRLITPKGDMPNSYHPPFDVLEGESFLWKVYDTLQTENPSAWQKTLFIVTFDEHGGCYDHVPPPPVPAIQGGLAAPPPFDRYGVRVPTILISPKIAPGSIFRAKDEGSPLDHCSLIRTALQCFVGPDAYINQRDRCAPDVSGALNPSVVNPGVPTQPALPENRLSGAQRDVVLSAPNHLSHMWRERHEASDTSLDE